MFLLVTNVAISRFSHIKGNGIVFLCLQIRIDGRVEKLSQAESNEYFHSRPIDSQISAAISQQSQPVPNRQVISLKYSNI